MLKFGDVKARGGEESLLRPQGWIEKKNRNEEPIGVKRPPICPIIQSFSYWNSTITFSASTEGVRESSSSRILCYRHRPELKRLHDSLKSALEIKWTIVVLFPLKDEWTDI